MPEATEVYRGHERYFGVYCPCHFSLVLLESARRLYHLLSGSGRGVIQRFAPREPQTCKGAIMLLNKCRQCFPVRRCAILLRPVATHTAQVAAGRKRIAQRRSWQCSDEKVNVHELRSDERGSYPIVSLTRIIGSLQVGGNN